MKNALNTRVIYNVLTSTLTAYLPRPTNGTAASIALGGAFYTLSIDSEGVDVAKWLNERDVAAFVLKYRLAHSFTNDPVAELLPKMANFKKLDEKNAPVIPLYIADDKRFVEYVRQHAKEIGIAPNRIDFMGFSAGDTVTMGDGLNYNAANRPDLLVPISRISVRWPLTNWSFPMVYSRCLFVPHPTSRYRGSKPADLTPAFLQSNADLTP